MEADVRKKNKFINESASIFSDELTAKYVHPLETELIDASKIQDISLAFIHPGKYQPRRVFDEPELVGLAESIMTHGVMQPVILRPVEQGYELIAGERRWRASKLAHLKTIPAIIRHISDKDALALSLIENIQRSNLNPIEEAIAFQRLMTEFNMTHEKISETVGKSRVSITNTLRLLKLPTLIQESISDSKIQAGHGRALLSAPESRILEVFDEVLTKNLSVRELEGYIRTLPEKTIQPQKSKVKQPHQSALMLQDLILKLFNRSCEVKIGKNGFIKIPFNSAETSDIIEKFKGFLNE